MGSVKIPQWMKWLYSLIVFAWCGLALQIEEIVELPTDRLQRDPEIDRVHDTICKRENLVEWADKGLSTKPVNYLLNEVLQENGDLILYQEHGMKRGDVADDAVEEGLVYRVESQVLNVPRLGVPAKRRLFCIFTARYTGGFKDRLKEFRWDTYPGYIASANADEFWMIKSHSGPAFLLYSRDLLPRSGDQLSSAWSREYARFNMLVFCYAVGFMSLFLRLVLSVVV